MDFAFCYFEREADLSLSDVSGLVNRDMDRKLAIHLVRNIRRFHPTSRITQLTNKTTPKLAADIDVLRMLLPEEKPMIARMLLYAMYQHSRCPTIFIDADMVICKPFEISLPPLTDCSVILCERSFVRGRIVHLKVPRVGLDSEEYLDMNIEDIMPFLGCFAITTNNQLWLHGLSLMISMESRQQIWNGDQIALKALYDSGRYAIHVLSEEHVAVPFNTYQKQANYSSAPFIHFKGNSKYSQEVRALLS